jgi:hypothetical protein
MATNLIGLSSAHLWLFSPSDAACPTPFSYASCLPVLCTLFTFSISAAWRALPIEDEGGAVQAGRPLTAAADPVRPRRPKSFGYITN